MSSRAPLPQPSAGAAIVDLDVTAAPDIPRGQVDAARARIERLGSLARDPIVAARLALRHGSPHGPGRYVADAHLLFDSRTLAAHTTGATPKEAADDAAERLERQLRRIVEADVAQRNEPRVIEAGIQSLKADRRYRPDVALKPPEERRIVHRRTFADRPESTLAAIADLLDLDEEFHLFRHVRTAEDVVVFRNDAGRISLLFPPGSALADENDIVVAQPSRYSEPLSLDTARAEMDMLNHRFLYFIDAADGRGKVLYLRHDGDYGLVEPPPC